MIVLFSSGICKKCGSINPISVPGYSLAVLKYSRAAYSEISFLNNLITHSKLQKKKTAAMT